jgi:pimeloyl-ACP methyl ester carboxylesterase
MRESAVVRQDVREDVREPVATDPPRAVLIHGAATTPRIYERVPHYLPDWVVRIPERRCSGSLDEEVAALAPLCADAFVAGVSGGATLTLALLMAGTPLRGAVLHEPAAGSLAAGLLDAVATAWATGGVQAFGTTLYGPAWTIGDAPEDEAAVARDLAMFRGFEPAPLPAGHPPAVLTVGELSPPIRHRTAAALSAFLGLPVKIIPAVGHALHLEAPAALAGCLRELIG